MGRLFLIDLEGSFFSCKHCFTHLALVNDIFSKAPCVSGRYGGGFLTTKVVNVMLGRRKELMLVKGLHTFASIYCVRCGYLVGFKFAYANEMTEKYKEGSFFMQWYRLMRPDGNIYAMTPPPPLEDA